MSRNKIPFCLPLINKGVELEVLSCLNETGWLKTGPKVKELEDEITELCQTSSTICVNSWTSGMLLLIRWLNLDEDNITWVQDDFGRWKKKMSKKKGIIVSGYFYPIYKGHIEYFNNAKALADELFVIVNSDHQRQLKGSKEFQK